MTGKSMRDGEAEDTKTDGATIGAALLHDLRTPLAAMRTAAEIVAREPLSITQKDALSTMTEAIDALLAMTAGLMKADRAATTARTKRESETFVPAEPEIRSLAELFAFIARAKAIGFSLDLDEKLKGQGIANPVALRRILSVLLDNAIKYTQAGSVGVLATVEASDKGRQLLLEVADTGCGISEADRDSLFQAYRRAGPAKKEEAGGQPDGTGLGLWNARELATAMGGTLELVETSSDGSRFRLRLPLGPSTGKQATPSSAQSPIYLRTRIPPANRFVCLWWMTMPPAASCSARCLRHSASCHYPSPADAKPSSSSQPKPAMGRSTPCFSI